MSTWTNLEEGSEIHFQEENNCISSYNLSSARPHARCCIRHFPYLISKPPDGGRVEDGWMREPAGGTGMGLDGCRNSPDLPFPTQNTPSGGSDVCEHMGHGEEKWG